MIESNYYEDNVDLLHAVRRLIDWEAIVPVREDDFRDARIYRETGDENLAMAPGSVEEALESYESIFASFGEVMGKFVAPRAAAMDRQGLRFEEGRVRFPQEHDDCYDMVRDAGLAPIALGRRYGGLGLPVTAQVLATELAARADAGFMLAFGCINSAEILERYADEELCREYVPRFAELSMCCAMALTEPDYGSNLADVAMRAERQADGETWLLNGTKRFISHACGHKDAPAAILTLARTGSVSGGARGLSFFLVEGKDVQVASIEKKLGLKCSPTCEVVYENAPGRLIGEAGRGLVKYAMGMMNSARLSIAAQGLGLSVAALRESERYASERVQFGRPLNRLPAVARMLERMRREVVAGRLLILEAAKFVDVALWRKENLERAGKRETEIRRDPELREAARLADLLTPLAKYYATEECVRATGDAIQIHGGAGYTEEYDVARLARDARITTIYEGTTQLQVIAAISGIVAGMAETGALRAYLKAKLSARNWSRPLIELSEGFESIVALYRSLGDGDERARLALEVVEICARLLGSVLLEEAAGKIADADDAAQGVSDVTPDYATLADRYIEESLGIVCRNLYTVQAARLRGVGRGHSMQEVASVL